MRICDHGSSQESKWYVNLQCGYFGCSFVWSTSLNNYVTVTVQEAFDVCFYLKLWVSLSQIEEAEGGCDQCSWLRGGWEHKSGMIQRLNCRLTGRSVFSHVTGHSLMGGPWCAPCSNRSSLEIRVYFHHMWSYYRCDLMTQWDWMKLSKKIWWSRSSKIFFLSVMQCQQQRVSVSLRELTSYFTLNWSSRVVPA